MNVDIYELDNGRFLVAGYVPCSGDYHDPVTGEIGSSPEELVEQGAPTFRTREKAADACNILRELPLGAIWIPDAEDCA